MNIVQASAQVITETHPLKKIELCGRVCYKSEERITPVSAYNFVAKLIINKHTSVLEHARVKLTDPVLLETLDKALEETGEREDYEAARELAAVMSRTDDLPEGFAMNVRDLARLFSDLSLAEIAKMENANPSDKAKQKKYGVMYGGYMAMQNAANNYLKLCAERGISPKFSHEKADFTTEENYWKLLIDRKMVDNVTGEVIEQQTIKPIFDEAEVMRILNDELERYTKVKEDQEYAIRKVTEAYLSGDLKGGMSAKDIAKVMQTPVDNVTNTNIMASAEGDELYSVDDYSDEYSYTSLTSKPDMTVTVVDDSIKYNRADIVYYARSCVKRCCGRTTPTWTTLPTN